MKKFLSVFALIPLALMFSGCQKVDNLSLLKENMSETNEVYFSSADGALFVTLTSGKREEPYLYDGKSCDKLDFALLSANLEGDDTELATISINGQAKDILLEFNFLSGMHVADLGCKLDGSEEVSFEFMGEVVKLKKHDFAVGFNDAIEIAYQNLQTEIDSLCNGGKFNGEGYLRVANYMDSNAEVVWLFSLLDGEKNMKNLVISTTQPQILADGRQIMI